MLTSRFLYIPIIRQFSVYTYVTTYTCLASSVEEAVGRIMC